MKKTIILAIAFVLGTTSLVASVCSSNYLLPPPSQNKATENKTTSIKSEHLKEEIIISSLEIETTVADVNYLKLQKKLKLAQAIRNYNNIAPSIIGKE